MCWMHAQSVAFVACRPCGPFPGMNMQHQVLVPVCAEYGKVQMQKRFSRQSLPRCLFIYLFISPERSRVEEWENRTSRLTYCTVQIQSGSHAHRTRSPPFVGWCWRRDWSAEVVQLTASGELLHTSTPHPSTRQWRWHVTATRRNYPPSSCRLSEQVFAVFRRAVRGDQGRPLSFTAQIHV